jgi:hypothetical protein
MRNFVTPKSHGIPRNSAEFRAIPYTLRNIRNSENTLAHIRGVCEAQYVEWALNSNILASEKRYLLLERHVDVAIPLLNKCSVVKYCMYLTWSADSPSPPSSPSPLPLGPAPEREVVFYTYCLVYCTIWSNQKRRPCLVSSWLMFGLCLAMSKPI